MPETIEVLVNGRPVQVVEGTSVAAAVFAAGEYAFRTSVSGQPRVALCGMGICFECRVTIDDREHMRSCQVVAKAGMRVSTT